MKNYNLSLYRLKKKHRNTQRVAAYILSRFKNVYSMPKAADIWYDIYLTQKLYRAYDTDLNAHKGITPTEEQETFKHILNKLLQPGIISIKDLTKWYEDTFNEYELLIDPITGLPCATSDYIDAKKKYNDLFRIF